MDSRFSQFFAPIAGAVECGLWTLESGLDSVDCCGDD